jgi:hypothetical protein
MNKTFLFLALMPTISYARVIYQTSWNTAIDLKNKTLIVQGQSSFSNSLVCSKIGLSYELSSIYSNTVIGRKYSTLNNIFLYPNYNQRITSFNVSLDAVQRVQEELNENLLVTDAKLDLSNINCRLATFNDYCDFATMNQWEIASIEELMKRMKRNNCRSLSAMLWKTKRLNLKNSKVMSYEFLSLMPRLRSVWVEGSYQDISSTINNINYINIFGEDKMVPFEIDVQPNDEVEGETEDEVENSTTSDQPDESRNDNSDSSASSDSSESSDQEPSILYPNEERIIFEPVENLNDAIRRSSEPSDEELREALEEYFRSIQKS